MIAPILWLSSTIFVYKLLVAPAGYSWIFENYAGTKDYVGFAILGSAMTGYWNNVLWGMGYALDRERWMGTIELLFLAPVSRLTLLIGECLVSLLESSWGVAYMLIVGALLFGVRINCTNPILTAVSFALSVFSMLGIGLFFASVFVLTRGARILANSLQTPIYFFSGVSFPVQVLPWWCQWISWCLPMTYGLDAFRKSILAGATFNDVAFDIYILIAFTTVYLVLGYISLKYLERLSTKKGSMSFY